ncbi:dimethyl sulfoxide reductase anchor subunit family protein [Actinomyces qiguomingii]|uniref:dimethyl sulfoxide reductase anchor subunit family protein n=1 Tax=Actinomyces qiguomingii TaxID=2057800 RepID=UPI000CA01F8B|nr:DmsC/YnfH family molybdoenzyme membrane anchor subunit [Actinomyces qiguomingii]
MNAAEVPMILFTVLAQMSVGAFWTLGVLQVVAGLRRHDPTTVDRVTRACLYAVGPLLVAGFIAASFHLGDPLHALNTFRNLGSSWLSREIAFGVLYGATGFAYAAAEWFGLGTRAARRSIAAITALAGLGLLVSMIQVYYSVRTIPAWHTPTTWVLFLGSALLTGPLAVGACLLLTWTAQRLRDTRGATGRWQRLLSALRITAPTPMNRSTSSLTAYFIQLTCTISALAGVALLVTYPLLLAHLGAGEDSASAHVLQEMTSSAALPIRLLMVALVVILVRMVAYARAKDAERPSPALVTVIATAFLLALGTELLGRGIHYEGLRHVGLTSLQSGLG